MKDWSFTAYDFFGYLVSGTAILTAINFAFETDWFSKPIPPTWLPWWIIATYVTGHVIAQFSSLVLEHGLLKRAIGIESVFFGDPDERMQSLFPGYARPLPVRVQAAVSKRATREGLNLPADLSKADRDLFDHCYAVLQQAKSPAISRMDTFLNLYGFSRNMSMAAGVAALLFLAGAFVDSIVAEQDITSVVVVRKLAMSAVAICICVVMFYRYLKFYRLHAIELYYAYGDDLTGQPKPQPARPFWLFWKT